MYISLRVRTGIRAALLLSPFAVLRPTGEGMESLRACRLALARDDGIRSGSERTGGGSRDQNLATHSEGEEGEGEGAVSSAPLSEPQVLEEHPSEKYVLVLCRTSESIPQAIHSFQWRNRRFRRDGMIKVTRARRQDGGCARRGTGQSEEGADGESQKQKPDGYDVDG